MKSIVITGATSGIGYAVCRAMAKENWAVLGVGRSEASCAATEQKLRGEFPKANIRFFPCDLSRQAQITRLGEALMKTLTDEFGGRLDALVNNAGCVRSYYTTTEDGYETVFAVNHLAVFLLTRLLLPALAAAQGRVLVTSSQSHRFTRLRWNDIMLSRRYSPLLAYKQSKLCNLLFALECNRLYTRQGVRFYGIDPGLVNTDIGEKNTSGVVRLFWRLRKHKGVSADTAAETYLYVLTHPDAQALYYGRCRPERCSRRVNEADAQRLWGLSGRLCDSLSS